MNRRDFLCGLGLVPAMARAQQGPPREERIERFTAPARQIVALSHPGFLPRSKKLLVVRVGGGAPPKEFQLRDIGQSGKFTPWVRPLRPVKSDFGDHMVGDFSDLDREALYQVTVGDERSVPFFIRPDLWRRTLPKAVSYFHAQRCGVAVANVHPACHLDDALRRDTREHVDVTGGWHDAGDLRKGMRRIMMNGYGLMHLGRNLGETWDPAGSGMPALLEEMRWGNRYFLKMQDADGGVWADAAVGVNSDNSDNHWTDNQPNTPDDRYINPEKTGWVQALFVGLEALVAQVFRPSDPGYGQGCLAAALRCWKAGKPEGDTKELCWWALAALELYRATGTQEFREAAVGLGRELLRLQQTEFIGGQREVRGFWKTSAGDATPYVDATDSALPPLALLELTSAFPDRSEAAAWREAVRLHVEEYAVPLAARSAYSVVPYGVFLGSPTPELYRPLAGNLTYRYFMPVRKQFWWLGMTSHLECYGLALARAAVVLSETRYRDLAFRQFEWVMGANPFGACLMTGEGMRNPYPYSRFVGPIIGGILNGIAGNVEDEPVLDMEYGWDWRTTEYWSPHNAYYVWGISALEA